MHVYWLEQSAECVPAHDDWLGVNEALVLGGMRFPKRRADWRLGRWTAKRALAAYLNVPDDLRSLTAIEIIAEPSGAPRAVFANHSAAATISLSHRAGHAICAIAQSGAVLGCDLEIIEPRSDAFAADYFTSEEQAIIARAPVAGRDRLLALFWSAKESVLKALRAGLRLDPRSVAIGLTSPPTSAGEDCWHPLEARYESQTFQGWWHNQGSFLRTLVMAQPLVPIPLWVGAEPAMGARAR